MGILFWSTFAVMAISTLVGLTTSLRLYERIGGATLGVRDGDLDRLVRESW